MKKLLVLGLVGLLALFFSSAPAAEAGRRGSGPSVYIVQGEAVVTSVAAGSRFDICGKSFPANKLAVAGVAGYLPFDQVMANGAGAFCHTYTLRSLSAGTYSAVAFYQKGSSWVTTSTTFFVT